MRILVACEYSGIVSQAFRAKGHSVLSCDLLPSEFPRYHYQGNVFNLEMSQFDMLIAFPPCTYLCKAQLWRCNKDAIRKGYQDDAIGFVQRLMSTGIPRIIIENPIGILSRAVRPPEQIISPHYFGSPYSKDICLWLKNVPPLIYTCMSPGKKKVVNHVNSRMSQAQKSKIKSKFFPEVAEAMANQWTEKNESTSRFCSFAQMQGFGKQHIFFESTSSAK